MKLLLSVFGHGWPRWKWITTWKHPANVFKFCTCSLQKSLKTYYGLLSFQTFTWYLPPDVPGAFCVWVKAFNLNFSEVLTKHEENPSDTAPLSLFKIYLKIVLKLQTEEKLETTTGFHVRLNQRILDLTDSSSYLDVCIDFLEYKEWCSARKRRTWSEMNFKANTIIMNGGKMELGATKLSQNHVLIILSWMLLKEKKYIFSLWVLFCFVVKIMLFIL